MRLSASALADARAINKVGVGDCAPMRAENGNAPSADAGGAFKASKNSAIFSMRKEKTCVRLKF
jgi:hypothetical protein